jgi:hypothetical protein
MNNIPPGILRRPSFGVSPQQHLRQCKAIYPTMEVICENSAEKFGTFSF